ncbi:YcnI family protein [Solwaraspora sp. WMMB335]|uniref:YcnI family copper-binding membrane protein n=1 Tax=Solwaraspora sp. WMMB335 TaxID=3404118 RepID=UPI003B9463B3
MLRHRRTLARAVGLTGAAVLVGVFGSAVPVAAHITVSPEQAIAGDYARLAFQVPNESDSASTTQVELVLPEDAPVASVTLLPVAGWTASVQRQPVDPPMEVHGAQVTEAVARIVWTADDPESAVQPGEFQEFVAMMGPLPDVDQMVFKSLQTYSDGNIVRWIEVPVPGQDEPATPASLLTVLAAADEPAAGDGTGPGDGAATGGESPAGEESAAGDAGTGSGLALGTGIVGLLAGLGGLLLGGLAFIRTRRAEPAPPTPASSATPAGQTASADDPAASGGSAG